jgi:hypothetical protein
MIKVGVRALHTHERRKHWCVLHGYNLPVIMILLGVSKRAVAVAMGGSFDGDSYSRNLLLRQEKRPQYGTQSGTQIIFDILLKMLYIKI